MSSDLLTMTAVADYLHYTHRSAALRWLRRHDVRMFWRGRRLLVRKADVDRVLEQHATGDTLNRARALSRKAS